MTTNLERLEALKQDIAKAIKLCDDEKIATDLGIRCNEIRNDLLFLNGLDMQAILALDTDDYLYFKGPNPHDDHYDAGHALLNMTLSIFTQLNGIIYFAAKDSP